MYVGIHWKQKFGPSNPTMSRSHVGAKISTVTDSNKDWQVVNPSLISALICLESGYTGLTVHSAEWNKLLYRFDILL